MTDRPEEDRVGRFEPCERIVGHHRTPVEIAFGAPVVDRSLQPEAVSIAEAIEHSHRGLGYLGADTVARDHGYVVGRHSPVSLGRL